MRRPSPPPTAAAPAQNGPDPSARVRLLRAVLVTWYRRRDNYTVLWGQRAGAQPTVLAEWFSREPLYEAWHDLLEREALVTPRNEPRGETVRLWAVTVKAGEAPAPWYAGPPLSAEERVLAVVVCEPERREPER